MSRGESLQEKPCRSCTSFMDYMKQTKKKLKDEENVLKNIPIQPRRADCPLDKDELGNKSWGLLHTIAANYPSKPSNTEQTEMKQFFTLFSKFYPCDHCAADLREELNRSPPQVNSDKEFNQWLCDLHNKINVKIGKPVFDCSKVNERWKDGWLDGSCD